jgi:hypothetical protein
MKKLLREMDSSLSGYMPPVTRGLFYTLFVSYVLISLLEIIGNGTPIVWEITGRIFELSPSQAIYQGHLWQFLLHPLNSGGALPLLFYMLTLFFLGGLVENRMGGRRLLWRDSFFAVQTGRGDSTNRTRGVFRSSRSARRGRPKRFSLRCGSQRPPRDTEMRKTDSS